MESVPSPRREYHVRLRDLPFTDALRVMWWRVSLTPTAKLRNRRFKESIQDGRGRDESLRIARSVAA